MNMRPYIPAAEDLAWANQMLSLLKDTGILVTSTGIYQVDKKAKTLTLLDAERLEDCEAWIVHYKHHYTWKRLGYDVLPLIDWESLCVPD